MNDSNPEITKKIEQLKRLPYSKSWMSSFVSKTHKVWSPEKKALEQRSFDEFIYVPASSLVRVLADDATFRAFRNDCKFENPHDLKLLTDKFENTNRSLAVGYVTPWFEAVELPFLIDDSYSIYILLTDLAKLADSPNEDLRKFYAHLAIPKTMGRRTGVHEGWK